MAVLVAVGFHEASSLFVLNRLLSSRLLGNAKVGLLSVMFRFR